MIHRKIDSSQLAFLLLFLFMFLPSRVIAQGLLQGVSGSLEFNYVYLSLRTTDATGNTVKTHTQGYNPRFRLDIDTKIWPNLKFRAGGTAEGIISDIDMNGDSTKTTLTKLTPYLDLTLETPLFKTGLGYQRQQEKTDISDFPSTTLISDYYYGIFGWKPEGLPTVDVLLSRRNLYDDDKSFLDIKEDFGSLTSRYEFQDPIFQGLYLDYYGTYLHRRDDLRDFDFTQHAHTGRVAYSNSFFDKRISLNTTYHITYQESITEGEGFVSTQIFPSAGLSSLDDFPADGTLDPNPALINGNITASAAIDIGLAGGSSERKNIGIDFVTLAQVNKLFIWVDRELPASISNIFPWDIYISSDNLNWAPVFTPFSVTFGPFDNRFEIKFTGQISVPRFIKVVTRGLTLADTVDPAYQNIFITEMQAFLETTAKAGKETIDRTTHNYDLDIKAMLLDNPSLYYELYYFFNRIEFGSLSLQRYDVSNSLNAAHRFSPIFSARAKVGIENGERESEREDEKMFAYFYDASLIADPLATLHNTLTFSGRNEEIEGRPNNINSLFLYNTAQLYQGIDLNLNGGVSFSKRETGAEGRDISFNVGVNVVPHRTLTLGLNYWETWTRLSGGERESSSTSTERMSLDINFNPFRTLYLYASIELNAGKGQETETTQNYTINWSPFPDGALQFIITYNENYRSEDSFKERIFTPSVRYKLGSRSYIELTYQNLNSDSKIEKRESDLVSTNLKLFF